MLRILLVLLALLLAAPAWAQDAPAPASSAPVLPQVEFRTSVGNFTLELYPAKAPKTVANFLKYVREGFYSGTVFHRVIAGFLVQGGIYDRELQQRRVHPPIPDEADNGLSNLRGTIAAARAPEVPRSATSQFFINLVDNRRLDFVSKQNGLTWGYAVFGKVIHGMEVIDKIGALPTIPLGPFSGDVPKPLVIIEGATVITDPAPASSADAPAEPAPATAATTASLHYSSGFVASRFQRASRVDFATEGRQGVVDTASSTPTERKPCGACDGAGAVDRLVNNAG